jgi:hypothetical protein
MGIEVEYLAATHANELSSLFTYMLLTNDPRSHLFFEEVSPKQETAIPGINSFIAHPTALLAGRGILRYQGRSQIQDHYEIQDPLDEEDQAANYVLSWLGDADANPNSVVLDGHNNTMPNLNFVRIGSLASKRSIAAAHIVTGSTNFVVRDDSFSDRIWTGAILEESTAGGLSDHIATAKKHYAGLYRLASESPGSLDDYYAGIIGELKFYRNIELPTFDQDGEIADYIPELESIDSESAFNPIDLSLKQRDRLQIGDADIMTGSWGYNNMSPKTDTSKRRLYFGNLFCKIAPPVPDGNVWVKQTEMARLRSMHDPEYIDSYISNDEADDILRTSMAIANRAAMALNVILADILREASDT